MHWDITDTSRHIDQKFNASRHIQKFGPKQFVFVFFLGKASQQWKQSVRWNLPLMRDIIFFCRAEKSLFYSISCPNLLVEKRLLAVKLFSNGVRFYWSISFTLKSLDHEIQRASSNMESIANIVRNGALLKLTLHKKWSFLLRISSANVTKSVGNCGFGHIYWRNP